jgi:hypothetical protein
MMRDNLTIRPQKILESLLRNKHFPDDFNNIILENRQHFVKLINFTKKETLELGEVKD